MSALSTKQMERTGQDYNSLFCTVVTGTLGAAAGYLCREQLIERKRTLYFHIVHILENI
jgi:hypothetical protein